LFKQTPQHERSQKARRTRKQGGIWGVRQRWAHRHRELRRKPAIGNHAVALVAPPCFVASSEHALKLSDGNFWRGTKAAREAIEFGDAEILNQAKVNFLRKLAGTVGGEDVRHLVQHFDEFEGIEAGLHKRSSLVAAKPVAPPE